MLLQRAERLEGAPGQRIALHVFHARFRLAFGARAIRAARAWLHAPVTAEGEIPRVKVHGARGTIASTTSARALSPRTLAGTPPKWANAEAIPSRQSS